MSDLAGMTVNERFYEVGLLSEWDSAKRRRDREAMIELLGRVGLADQALEIANAALNRKS